MEGRKMAEAARTKQRELKSGGQKVSSPRGAVQFFGLEKTILAVKATRMVFLSEQR